MTGLVALLQDDDSSVRSIAAYALDRLGKMSSNITQTVADWIEQNQNFKYVGDGIDILWLLVTKQA